MTGKFLIIVFVMTTVLLGTGAAAQQSAKIPRIGLIEVSATTAADRVQAFRQGLRELGYVEGQNILIEYRSGEGKLDRSSVLVADLVRLKVDVIVSGGASTTRAAAAATSSIPIVMTQDPDPVGNGFVASLARPGGNITGLSSLIADLSGKRLELLNEILPRLSRVAVFESSTNAGNARQLKETELAARALKVKLQYVDLKDPSDLDAAFRAVNKDNADAILVLSSPVTTAQRAEILALVAKSRLPAIYDRSEVVEAGGLMSYGVRITDLDRRAAIYVDKILKGANPGDLPVEQPRKLELVINLKTAKQIGLTISPNLLARADKIIR